MRAGLARAELQGESLVKQSIQIAALAAAPIVLAACATVQDDLPPADAPVAAAYAETQAVASTDDAADDPAIWVNPADPAASLVLGTDKQRGLGVYNLQGEELQFLESGRLNNVDLRQGWEAEGVEALAAASNRTDNSVVLFGIAADGAVRELGRFPTGKVEPYGLCMGETGDGADVFVTYKDGTVQRFSVLAAGPDGLDINDGPGWKLDTQLEGCVVDEANNAIFIGEEARGLWRAALDGSGEPALIDEVGGANGLTADVEGISLYRGASAGEGYVVVSSQGDSTFHLYDRAAPHAWRGRVTTAYGEDAVTGTDGIAVTSAPLGEALPEGLLVVQDDINSHPDAPQNFKLIGWTEVREALAE